MFTFIASLSSSKSKIFTSITIFFLIVGVLGFWAPELSTVTTNEDSEFLPKGSESLKSLELSQKNFPTGSGLPAVIVITSKNNLSVQDKEKVSEFIDLIKSSEILDKNGLSVIGQIMSPINNDRMEQSMISSDKTTMQVLINIQGAPSEDSFQEAVDFFRFRFNRKVVPLMVTSGLHLKTGITYLGKKQILAENRLKRIHSYISNGSIY